MEFQDELRSFSTRIDKLIDQIKTEEATKTSLILPFFQLLGYDIFNPNEFVPEFIADTGIKKGEKVDYAILQNGKPIILIEAKWCGEKLEKHDSQLYRYFATTTAKFAILTNGVIYRFYTDLDETNKMDNKPFLELNLLDIKESLVSELKKFQKSRLDLNVIFNSASELKYSNQIKQLLSQQLENPTDSFVGYLLSEIFVGRKTQNVIDKYRDTVKKSFNQFINEIMNERIKAALEKQAQKEDENNNKDMPEENEEVETKINTTMEELEGFFIVKSLLKGAIPPKHNITYKDTESYFGVLLDNNTWRWICRITIGNEQKSITIPDENKKGIKYNISSIDDIYNYKDKLMEVVKRYI
ncbi:MAG: endonuclease [Firmicutes bacterium HGW-Firmicutes-12]|jgi:hypothetical protein|nr:MAG: endonuclease [Firmicutes bacterium HGW-Firmicutes-12]